MFFKKKNQIKVCDKIINIGQILKVSNSTPLKIKN